MNNSQLDCRHFYNRMNVTFLIQSFLLETKSEQIITKIAHQFQIRKRKCQEDKRKFSCQTKIKKNASFWQQIAPFDSSALTRLHIYPHGIQIGITSGIWIFKHNKMLWWLRKQVYADGIVVVACSFATRENGWNWNLSDT